MLKHIVIAFRTGLFAIGIVGLYPRSVGATGVLAVAPTKMHRIAVVDDRYQSYNVEMAEVVGAKFWKPYKNGKVQGRASDMFEKRPPIDLANRRLRKLAAALGPAYIRVSGTWANSVYFAGERTRIRTTPPKGFQSVLTPREWESVIDFSHAVHAQIVTSFAISPGVRNSKGIWTPVQAKLFLNFTKARGGNIAAAEFFNEPSYAAFGGAPAHYTAMDYARDFAVFRSFAAEAAPDMALVGPGSVGEAGKLATEKRMPILHTRDLLAASPPSKFGIYSYHSYAAASIRCASLGRSTQTTPGAALSDRWLSQPDEIYSFYIALRNRFEPGSPVWITETADAACGGNPWASTFLDTFRYLDQLGRLAKRNVQVVFHNTLASSDYGLLDQNTFAPRPNYWAALLWHRLMGRVVLDAGPSPAGLRLYAQCERNHSGGVSLLAINTSRARQQVFRVPMASRAYTLTADALESSAVRLNGHMLQLALDDDIPPLSGQRRASGNVLLAPASITFLTVDNASNPNCR